MLQERVAGGRRHQARELSFFESSLETAFRRALRYGALGQGDRIHPHRLESGPALDERARVEQLGVAIAVANDGDPLPARRLGEAGGPLGKTLHDGDAAGARVAQHFAGTRSIGRRVGAGVAPSGVGNRTSAGQDVERAHVVDRGARRHQQDEHAVRRG